MLTGRWQRFLDFWHRFLSRHLLSRCRRHGLRCFPAAIELRLQEMPPLLVNRRPEHWQQQAAFFVPFERGRTDIAPNRRNWTLREVFPDPPSNSFEPFPQTFAWLVEAGKNATLCKRWEPVPFLLSWHGKLDYWERAVDPIVRPDTGFRDILPLQVWQQLPIPERDDFPRITATFEFFDCCRIRVLGSNHYGIPFANEFHELLTIGRQHVEKNLLAHSDHLTPQKFPYWNLRLPYRNLKRILLCFQWLLYRNQSFLYSNLPR